MTQYGFEPDYFMYGKPENVTYEFAERVLETFCKKEGVQISNYYMIGDNPLSDIEGGKRRGKFN